MSNIIKYSDCSHGVRYGADGVQLSNWNPELDYENEYVKVYFRIDAKGYKYPEFSFTAEEGAAFDKEVAAVFEKLGWKCESEAYNGRCSTWKHGKSHLYLHPQNFSGVVLKNEIKTVAEAIWEHATFRLRWVDLYETVHDLTDAEYDTYLSGMLPDIKHRVLTMAKTRRRDLYCNQADVVYEVAKRIALPRVGLEHIMYGASDQTSCFVKSVIELLIQEGYLISVTHENKTLIRTINQKEQRERKLSVK